MSTFTYPPNFSNIPTYASFSALPSSAADGQAAITLDTDTLYIYNLATTTWLPIGSPGTVISLGAVGSSPNANAALITAGVLQLEFFNSTYPGVVPLSGGGSTNFLRADGTWAIPPGSTSGTVTSVAMSVPSFLSISGSPITTSGTLAITLSGTALPVLNGGTGVTSLGNFTDVGTDGITVTGGTGAVVTSMSIAQHVADDTHNGYLSSTDWTTFNSKGSGSVTSVALTVPSFLSISGSPITTSGTLAISLSGTALPVLNGGTGVTALGNFTDAGTDGITVTGGTGAVITSMSIAQHVADSSHNGYLSSTDWTTFNGKGSGTVTSVTFTGDGTVLSSTPSSAVTTSGTVTASLKTQTAATFLAGPTSGSAAAPTFRALQTPTIQKFTSGSGTCTIATGALYIRVRMVGGGGGGGAGGTSGGTAATNGGDTTFGTTLLSAGGGKLGANGADGGAGGTSSLGSGPIGTALTGGNGQGASTDDSGTILSFLMGGQGASSFLGGCGKGGGAGTGTGGAGSANTGGGGGGGAANDATTQKAGSGGGSGGMVDALISSPSATYSYAVGAGGSAQAAGTFAGGAGGSGYIEVTEYYQ